MCLFVVGLLAVASPAENKGNCPPSPPVEKHDTNPNDQSGKITLQAVVSETGSVCSAKVVNGIDGKTDADAEKLVRQWHFTPANKNGRPVSVVVMVDVHYERDKDGKLALSAQQSSPAADPKQ
jgi:TonB family protein